VYIISVGHSERKRLLLKPRRRWKGGGQYEMYLKQYDYVDWIHLAEDMDRWLALVSTVMNLQVP